MQSFQLQNHENIMNVPFDTFDHDYELVFKDEIRVHFSKLLLCIVSPKIAQNLNIDPTNSTFRIELDYEKNKKVLKDFIDLSLGKRINIKIKQMPIFIEIATIFGNKLISNMIYEKLIEEEITKENVINRLTKYWGVFPTEKEIEYLSKHLITHDFSSDDLSSIPVGAMEAILISRNFENEDEDALFDIIKGMNEPIFFDYLKIENLSYTKFAEFVNTIEFKDLNFNIWVKISSRISKPLNELESEFSILQNNNDEYELCIFATRNVNNNQNIITDRDICLNDNISNPNYIRIKHIKYKYCGFKTNGRRHVLGTFYFCNTCFTSDSNFLLCQECAENCHKGHDLFQTTEIGYCDCCANELDSFQCQNIGEELTKCPNMGNEHFENELGDKVYFCCNCQLEVCLACASICHKNHKVEIRTLNKAGPLTCKCIRMNCKMFD